RRALVWRRGCGASGSWARRRSSESEALLTSARHVKGRRLATAPMIRSARPDDVPAMLSLIRALARYEKLEHEVVGTEEDLREHLFGTHPRAEVALVEDGS